jgi:methionyl-tRNA formyltransferase
VAVRVGFAGTNWWAAEALRRLAEVHTLEIGLVLSQPDRPAGRGRKPAASPVVLAARELGLAVAQPERAADALPLLEASGARSVGVVAYGLLVPRALLAALPFVNLHPSALPRWRGAAPIERALMAGDAEGAVAAILLVEALDAGPIAALERFAVPADDDAGASRARSSRQGVGGCPPCRRSGRRPTPQKSSPPIACSIPRGRRGSCTTRCERSRRTQPPGGRRMAVADWLRGLRGPLPAVAPA